VEPGPQWALRCDVLDQRIFSPSRDQRTKGFVLVSLRRHTTHESAENVKESGAYFDDV